MLTGRYENSVSVATALQAEIPRNRGSILGRDRDFSLHHSDKTGPGTH